MLKLEAFFLAPPRLVSPNSSTSASSAPLAGVRTASEAPMDGAVLYIDPDVVLLRSVSFAFAELQAERSAERLAAEQRYPAHAAGASAASLPHPSGKAAARHSSAAPLPSQASLDALLSKTTARHASALPQSGVQLCNGASCVQDGVGKPCGASCGDGQWCCRRNHPSLNDSCAEPLLALRERYEAAAHQRPPPLRGWMCVDPRAPRMPPPPWRLHTSREKVPAPTNPPMNSGFFAFRLPVPGQVRGRLLAACHEAAARRVAPAFGDQGVLVDALEMQPDHGPSPPHGPLFVHHHDWHANGWPNATLSSSFGESSSTAPHRVAHFLGVPKPWGARGPFVKKWLHYAHEDLFRAMWRQRCELWRQSYLASLPQAGAAGHTAAISCGSDKLPASLSVPPAPRRAVL